MKELQKKLLELMKKSKQEPSPWLGVTLYNNLIDEELNEFNAEVVQTPDEFKELCDLIWVLIQYANCMGYDIDAGMKLLVKEYESKFLDKDGNFNPIYREDGKLLKGPLFKKADFTSIMPE